MSLQQHLTLDREGKRVDEEILNVIRESEAGFVGTTEISNSSSVDRGEDTVRTRLNDLEEEGRVKKKRIGDAENGNFAWYLPEDARTEAVNPDIYWAVRVCENGRQVGESVLRGGIIVAVAGVALMMMSLTAGIAGLQLGLMNSDMAASLGYIVTAAGLANVVVGGILKFGPYMIERQIEKRASN